MKPYIKSSKFKQDFIENPLLFNLPRPQLRWREKKIQNENFSKNFFFSNIILMKGKHIYGQSLKWSKKLFTTLLVVAGKLSKMYLFPTFPYKLC